MARPVQYKDRGLPTVAAAGVFAAWFWATVGASHPNPLFGRIRRFDALGVLLPNWRFFAPHPGIFDYALIYRVEEADGTMTDWNFAMPAVHRSWTHAVWFPGRRQGKALFDIAAELLVVVRTLARQGTVTSELLERRPSFRALRSFIASVVGERYAGAVAPRGFQFALVQHTGHEEQEPPAYLMVSSFVPFGSRPAA